ncbi:hypothetical protein MUP77_03405 [Candidatus Bathyarchaeota archaeon]|jgi:hypothetical protein|nr:hypothetical protein [Candidatus Bathyarchaeota archaeon]
MDKEGIAFGILLSLLVQGFYEVIFYTLQGKFVEEWAASAATLGAFATFLGLLHWKGYFKKQKIKK